MEQKYAKRRAAAKEALEWKQKANEAYAQKEYKRAVDLYGKVCVSS